jgi:hypothetical protein
MKAGPISAPLKPNIKSLKPKGIKIITKENSDGLALVFSCQR